MAIDLRSDTLTKPTPAMHQAMMEAEVGDDMFGEDPTVAALEKKAAKMFGMDAAIYCASGTMTNQIGIRLHCNLQDEVICHKYSHIYLYESGGIMSNAGASVRLLEGERGRITAKAVESAIQPDDIHSPVSRLVSLENTANKGGGSCYDFEEIWAIRETCHEHGLALHLDGARLFNALVATGQTTKQYGEVFDTISICLSKGLGAPVGSLLIGSHADIKRAKRIRKVMGGAWRQAGYVAAAGLYALENHVDRLVDDHNKAKEMAKVLEGLDYVEEVLPCETNILIFKLTDKYTNQSFLDKLAENDILAFGFGPQLIRFVTHYDFTDDDLTKTIEVLKKL
ncbi:MULTISPECIES: threonine aldolase family protein [Roseivirga]|uniref:Threonine aldolase n=1 Tax=Roseivirga spongicola TaxID=333140 RepID=A0A150XI59_9BACT|nr:MULTISPECIES: GntG family PLP-dependent aldolase [Roseivirga]KYG78420.1 threonine aldolase [Roseivirga spongicola]MBO6660757.1 aminotransferase class I/II-fold pyridoxal phosphate-dependent enzyme [Roseivirga sp.]MBO6761900.1 aminotransferase class I/II-fold pyridoxal phosphate-dependent enzyme [Roseivirga sp.]MBO6909259.1 aminotransferase class I/II-fold pyridoxal phosphate-dependent enzyme [Roseivirga sp.]WPZ12167.1 GntG family PLP-dependent aldolase [Roseivirga spongicola]